FSTTTFRLSNSESRLANCRATRSPAPPAGTPTINVISRSGYSARAGFEIAVIQSPRANRIQRRTTDLTAFVYLAQPRYLQICKSQRASASGAQMRRLVLIALLAILNTPVKAETWPSRPLTMVVPFATGGPMDAVARILQSALSDALQQQVIVENVGGAGGM